MIRRRGDDDRAHVLRRSRTLISDPASGGKRAGEEEIILVLLTAAGLHSSPQTPSACSTCGIATDRQSSCLLVSPADLRTTDPGDECQPLV